MSHLYEYNNVDQFIKDFNSGKIGFPYKRLYYTDTQITDKFNNLVNIDFGDRIVNKYYKIHNVTINTNRLLYLQKPTLLLSNPDDYQNSALLSDMFQEKNRMLCKFISASLSPMDYFNKHIKELATKTILNHKKINPYILREELYDNIKECSSFNLRNMLYIVRLFGAKSVLDPSSGWGDRLIAALSLKIRYVGVDPNHLLHPVYKEMIKFFNKGNSTKVKMIESKIQDAVLPNEKFDLIFTSPPYYKIEKYSNNGETIDKTEDEWFNNFMIPMIDKTHKKLNTNGHLVLVINQMSYEHYIYKMIKYIRTINDYHYLGVISYSNQQLNNPQPMWIWRKALKIPVELYNPPIEITQHNSAGIKFNVIRDDYLIGGTKQRALVDLILNVRAKNKNITKFIYAGPNTGYAQIALAYCCYLTKTKAVVFTSGGSNKTDYVNSNRTNLTKFAMTFDIELHEIHNGNINLLTQKSEEYHLQNKKTSYLIPFGSNNELYLKFLSSNIKNAFPSKINPKRMWLVAGSATILNALYIVFPKTFFMVVQVGRTIWDDLVDKSRTEIFISDETFYEVAKEQPPYQTVSTYDAKLWVFFMKHGRSDDYIWNVAKDISNI